MVNDELEGTWTLRHKNFANRTIFRATFSSFSFKNYNWFFTALYLMNLSMLTLAIDQEDIRKEKEKLLWRVDCICFSRNEKWTWQRFGSRTTSFKTNQNETTQRITNEPIASSSCQDMTPSRSNVYFAGKNICLYNIHEAPVHRWKQKLNQQEEEWI